MLKDRNNKIGSLGQVKEMRNKTDKGQFHNEDSTWSTRDKENSIEVKKVLFSVKY